ncbi:serine protease inhibitor Kazal-type 13 [Molossus nigricans]
MAAFPQVTIFFLVSSIGILTAFAAMKPHDFSRWPPPPCKLYYPTDPLYQLDEPECPNVTAYVCAQDGHTYQNECFFCVARWEFGPRIKFDKYGKCG